MYTGNS